MDRAYSLLQIKSIDDDLRVIHGVATTPSTDRMGDVIESAGAAFTLPLPLLWQHDSHQPIGEVQSARVTKDGIEITAKIAAMAEPGRLKDRLDEAWQSIKTGLVRGLSIGFKSLEVEPIKGTFGVRFLKWMWLELSAVTIPANQEATILLVKSCDTPRPAAHGTGQGVRLLTLPGASGSTAGHSMKTLTEQITAFEATRQAKAARMTELMTKAGDEGVTLDAAQTEEYDGLAGEVKGIDSHLTRLADLEKTNKAAAKPAAGDTAEHASESRGGVQVSVKDTPLPPGTEFARYAMCLLTAKGNTPQALEIAKQRYPDQVRIHTVLKAAVAAGTTTDPTWAGALVDYQNFAGDFSAFLRPQTIIGKFGTGGIPALRAIPFNVAIKGQTSGGSGYWVGEGAPKPLTKFDFSSITLRWAKVANIAVLSDELVRFSSPSAEALVRDGLAKALIERMDIDFINPAKSAVADVSPASITNGIAAGSSAGPTSANVRADITALFQSFIAANLTPTSGVWIMPNTVALQLSLMVNALGQPEFPGITMNGGTFHGLPVIASQYAALGGSPNNNLVILLNASDIYLADDGQVVIEASKEASLEMASDPTNSVSAGSPAAPVATHLVSLWQTNSLGLRAERYINWARRRDEAVAYLEHVAWTA